MEVMIWWLWAPMNRHLWWIQFEVAVPYRYIPSLQPLSVCRDWLHRGVKMVIQMYLSKLAKTFNGISLDIIFDNWCYITALTHSKLNSSVGVHLLTRCTLKEYLQYKDQLSNFLIHWGTEQIWQETKRTQISVFVFYSHMLHFALNV